MVDLDFVIYSPCLFASVDPIFNGSRLNPRGKELDQGRLETEHDCVQSGQPAVWLKRQRLVNEVRST